MNSGSSAPTVWVFSESYDLTQQLLTAGRTLADQFGGRLWSVFVGEDDAAGDCLNRGADEALVLVLPSSAPTEEISVFALARAVATFRPGYLLLAATRTGNEIAARLAHRFSTGCATGCLSVSAGESGLLMIDRRCYGGRFVETQVVSGSPCIATILPDRYASPEPCFRPCGPIRRLEIEAPAARIKRLDVKDRVRSGRSVEKADIIVAAGRGVKQKEDLQIVERLAARLGGEVAGSRPLTDDLQWLSPDVKVGLSGHTVRPRLYIACGISGQIEHIVGMRSARTVVAINSDPDAPIHEEADYSVVADLYQFIPTFLEVVGQ